MDIFYADILTALEWLPPQDVPATKTIKLFSISSMSANSMKSRGVARGADIDTAGLTG